MINKNIMYTNVSCYFVRPMKLFAAELKLSWRFADVSRHKSRAEDIIQVYSLVFPGLRANIYHELFYLLDNYKLTNHTIDNKLIVMRKLISWTLRLKKCVVIKIVKLTQLLHSLPNGREMVRGRGPRAKSPLVKNSFWCPLAFALILVNENWGPQTQGKPLGKEQ